MENKIYTILGRIISPTTTEVLCDDTTVCDDSLVVDDSEVE